MAKGTRDKSSTASASRSRVIAAMREPVSLHRSAARWRRAVRSSRAEQHRPASPRSIRESDIEAAEQDIAAVLKNCGKADR